MSPTVFGTKVISTESVFPAVILVFCRMTLFESFWGEVFPAVAVDVSACTALSTVNTCRGHKDFQISLILSRLQIKVLQVSDSGQSERGVTEQGLEGFTCIKTARNIKSNTPSCLLHIQIFTSACLTCSCCVTLLPVGLALKSCDLNIIGATDFCLQSDTVYCAAQHWRCLSFSIFVNTTNTVQSLVYKLPFYVSITLLV